MVRGAGAMTRPMNRVLGADLSIPEDRAVGAALPRVCRQVDTLEGLLPPRTACNNDD